MKNYFFRNRIAFFWILFFTFLFSFNQVEAESKIKNHNLQNEGTWEKTNNKWWFKYTNKTGYSIGWQKNDKKWYYFDKEGYMQTGWVKPSDGEWYYLNKSGKMHIGWLEISDGKWYYLRKSGQMVTSYQKISNIDYNFSSDGLLI